MSRTYKDIKWGKCRTHEEHVSHLDNPSGKEYNVHCYLKRKRRFHIMKYRWLISIPSWFCNIHERYLRNIQKLEIIKWKKNENYESFLIKRKDLSRDWY
jgi:hypothetical protein